MHARGMSRAGWPGVWLCVLLGGCAAVQPADCAAPATRMARVELLLGATRADGSVIDGAPWDAFLATAVTPRFPAGLTELSGRGQWRRPDGEVAQVPTRVLLSWYTPSGAAEAGIEAIRSAYKAQFGQLSVMRVDGADCVSF